MAFPYKKIDEADLSYLRSQIDPKRILVGAEIPEEYYHDEMPEYGIFAPEVYVEVLNKEEVAAVLAYATTNNIPVTAQVQVPDLQVVLPVNSEAFCCLL